MRLLICGALAALAAHSAQAEVSERIMRVAGTTVSYKLVLPNDYDATKAYPAILVFGGGPQTMNTIEGTLARNFQAEAEQRGYIVIGPAAPDGDLFFYDGDRIFPEFLDNIRAAYKIDGRTVNGVNIGAIWTETENIGFFNVGAYNRTYDTQTGLTIGLLNHAHNLAGIQIGLLNIVETNPEGLRYLPILNVKF